ncbi:hypothetical protein [Streptomyces sp. NPDC058145]
MTTPRGVLNRERDRAPMVRIGILIAVEKLNPSWRAKLTGSE